MKKSKEYYITDGKNFAHRSLSNNKYTFTSNISLAEVWDSPTVAEAVINNSISPQIRGKCYVAYEENGKIIPYSLSPDEKRERANKIKSGKGEKATVNTYVLKQYSIDDDKDIRLLIDGMEGAKNALEFADNKYRTLEERLIYLDYADEDLKHYLGHKRLNAREGYKLTNLRQQVVLERISLKNQLEIVRKIREKYHSISEPINEICKTIDDLRKQKYEPRVLPDLFEKGVDAVEIRSRNEC